MPPSRRSSAGEVRIARSSGAHLLIEGRSRASRREARLGPLGRYQSGQGRRPWVSLRVRVIQYLRRSLQSIDERHRAHPRTGRSRRTGQRAALSNSSELSDRSIQRRDRPGACVSLLHLAVFHCRTCGWCVDRRPGATARLAGFAWFATVGNVEARLESPSVRSLDAGGQDSQFIA